MSTKSPEETTLSPGDRILDRYEIESVIGAGAFAQIYKGVDVSLGRTVAIKVLRPRFGEQGGMSSQEVRDQALERFHREAKMTAKLRDIHTVTLFDYGKLDDDDLFMVMEFVPGISLRDLIQRDRQLGDHRVVRILTQCLLSLREAHVYGTLHRDIKPENIMTYEYLGLRDQVVLVDFGIAKTLEDEDRALTAAGVLVGTPRYVPPERIKKEPMMPASDIYSLGIVAYEMLVGTNPFKGMQGMDIIRRQLEPAPIKLPEDLAVSSHLRDIVERMLEKDLETRYRAAEQVLADLEKLDMVLRLADIRANLEGEEEITWADLETPDSDRVLALAETAKMPAFHKDSYRAEIEQRESEMAKQPQTYPQVSPDGEDDDAPHSPPPRGAGISGESDVRSNPREPHVPTEAVRYGDTLPAGDRPKLQGTKQGPSKAVIALGVLTVVLLLALVAALVVLAINADKLGLSL